MHSLPGSGNRYQLLLLGGVLAIKAGINSDLTRPFLEYVVFTWSNGRCMHRVQVEFPLYP